MLILGLNAFHANAAACLIRDGNPARLVRCLESFGNSMTGLRWSGTQVIYVGFRPSESVENPLPLVPSTTEVISVEFPNGL